MNIPNTMTSTRKCSTDREEIKSSGKQIRVPISKSNYMDIIEKPDQFRKYLDEMITMYPELFPNCIKQGYKLDGFARLSKKMPKIRLRRICPLNKGQDSAKKEVYTVGPSFILPYMTGDTENVEKAIFLHQKFNVPFWALTYVFGRNDMYWYRICQHIGRNSIVGTTVRQADNLPEDLVADEKHTHLNGQKAYVATTVAKECVLGASIVISASTQSLIRGYRQFKNEALALFPEYRPRTVNTDGWLGTQQAWQTLFTNVVIIMCFLHAYLKVRNRMRRSEELHRVSKHVWEAFGAKSKGKFLRRLKTLRRYASKKLKGEALQAVLKLYRRGENFVQAYDYPECHRTSNMVDRHMDGMDRYLYSVRYFHGNLMSAEIAIRAWALTHNFMPYCPRAKVSNKFISPVHRLNNFVYRDNWLENLLVATSLGGSSS